jgi:hypothetical protein
MNVCEVNDIGHSKILLMFVSILSSYFPAIHNHLCSRGQFCDHLTAMSQLTHYIHLFFCLLCTPLDLLLMRAKRLLL